MPLSGPPARYVQLRGLSEVEGRPFMSAAEVSVEVALAVRNHEVKNMAGSRLHNDPPLQ